MSSVNPQPLWPHIKERLKSRLPAGAFNIWIESITPLKDDGQRLVLGCPNRFSVRWVTEHFGSEIKEALRLASGNSASLSFEVAPPPKPAAVEHPVPCQPDLPYKPGRLLTAASPFNQEFTFDNFITGPANLFAHQAASALATGLEPSLNSLYLQADTGLGKSHLSQAVCQKVLSASSKARVLYLTAEEFTNQMVAAIRTNQAARFKDRFRRGCDTLILEEVQFLSGKEKTQAELGFTLDALQDEGKKVVFTSSRLPKEIPGLRKELASRLGNGVVTTIGRPEFDTRRRIILAKAKKRGIDLPIGVAETLAEAITGDVRRLESALMGLVARSRLLGRSLTRALAREVLAGTNDLSQPSIEAVIDLVCRYYSVTPEEMRSRSRLKRIATPRTISLYLCRKYTDESLSVIGQAFDRKHTTVLYALDRVERAIKHRDSLGSQVKFLSQKMRALF